MSNKQEKPKYILEEESTYQTGSTQPPKNYRGLILFLLGLVIFLGGIATALGFTNIRLFRALTNQAETTPNAVAFSYAQDQDAAVGAKATGLGFSGETVSEFWHNYHDLPRGIFVQVVEEGSSAALQGLLPGDILTHVNGTPVASLEQLQTLLDSNPADTVEAVIYRNEEEFTVRLTVTNPEE